MSGDEFARALCNVMTERNCTVGELAREIGRTTTTVQRARNGRHIGCGTRDLLLEWMRKPESVRSGKYRLEADIDDELPGNVLEALNEKNPDWDWCCMGDGRQGWVVLRQMDDGKEICRVAAVVKREVWK